MEFDLESSCGKLVNDLLSSYVAKSSVGAVEKLKRVFTFLPPKITNEDSLLCALYGQEAVEESPVNLVRAVTSRFVKYFENFCWNGFRILLLFTYCRGSI